MSFGISPSVNVREVDLTTTAVEQVSSVGSFAGKFAWGPILQRTLVSNEPDLAVRFGAPQAASAVDFMTASSFLAYSSGINIVRVADSAVAKNATDNGSGVLVLNDDTYDQTAVAIAGNKFIAKYAGAMGNSLAVTVCSSASQFERVISGNWVANVATRSRVISYTSSVTRTSFTPTGSALTISGFNYTVTLVNPTTISVVPGVGAPAGSVYIDVDDIIIIAGTSYYVSSISGDTFTVQSTPISPDTPAQFVAINDKLVIDGVTYIVTGVSGSNITLNKIYTGVANPTMVVRKWGYASSFSSAPAADSFHIVVIDADGLFTKEPGSVLEKFESVSTAINAKYDDGTSRYYIDAVNTSQFIRVGGTAPVATTSLVTSYTKLANGVDGFDQIGEDEYIAGYDLFSNSEEVDAPLLIAGGMTSSGVLANYIIQNIAEVRKDSIVFVSPRLASVVNNKGQETSAVLADREDLPSTSYAALDSGWKYMFDKYNGVYRWVPLCGDHAGLYARVDRDRDPWYSAGGTNRGLIKNVVKLAWSPDQTNRDALYVKGVNPVTDLPGFGPTMFGDKTLLNSTSAFSRINVRRLFIVLEKTIATAARELLFEFNDEFTQNRFIAIVEPFLRDVQGRRGITKFEVLADERVNTPQVVAANRFVGQIYVVPTQTINFIRLDFVAVGPTVNFEEVVGTV